jgi:restriction system protein
MALEIIERRILIDKRSGIESIRKLSWSSFEMLVGQAYRQLGFRVIETGLGGRDGGIDLKLQKDGILTIVQCKHWKAWKVGVSPILELYGVLMAGDGSRAVFVTSGDFTKEAREFAKGKPMELIDGDGLQKLIGSAKAGRAPASEVSAPLPNSAPEKTMPCRLGGESVASPHCPRCNQTMLLRTARRGTNAGRQFWGCSGYPRCNGVRGIETTNAK